MEFLEDSKYNPFSVGKSVTNILDLELEHPKFFLQALHTTKPVLSAPSVDVMLTTSE